MPDQTLRVLVAEDHALVTEVLKRFLEQLRKQFPKLQIQTVETLAETLEIIRSNPPDLITLDLGLKGTTPEETLAHLPEIEAACPVVVVTGKNLDDHQALLNRLNITVIEKGQSWMADNRLLRACTAAVVRRTELSPLLDRDSKLQERLRKMRELTEQLFSPQIQDGQRTP